MPWNISRIGIFRTIIALVLFSVLVIASNYNYMFFHALAELFAVVISCGILIVAWNTRKFNENDFILFIGISFIYMGFIDILHLLAYKGMNVFQHADANLPTQLWVMARYMQSGSLLLAPLFFTRRVSEYRMLFLYFVITALLLATIFYWKVFPVCYAEGKGLTAFKIASEYLVIAILVSAGVHLSLYRNYLSRGVFNLLLISLGMMIVSEVFFSMYIDVFDASNTAGHITKIIAFFLLYRAIIQTGLATPYKLLFMNLKASEENIKRAHEELEVKVRERTAELSRTVEALQHEVEERMQVEEELKQRTAELQRSMQGLNLLYTFSDMIHHRDFDVDYLLKRVVDMMPAVYKDQAPICVRMIMNEKEYVTDNFKESSMRDVHNIAVGGKPAGVLEIHCTEDHDGMDSCFLLNEEQGLIEHIAVQIGEIFERKIAEDALRKAEQQEKLAAIGQLAAGISHDFNNILNVIKVMSELTLMEKDISEFSRDRLTTIISQVNRAVQLVRQILDFSRQSVVERKPVDLLPLVIDIKKFFERIMPENIRIFFEFEAGNFTVMANPNHIQQIITNLVINAKDAMEEGGVLKIGLQRVFLSEEEVRADSDVPSGEWVVLYVSDTGMGIPQEHTQHLFEPFFTTKAVGKGTGLGLAQVYGLVKQHDGFIAVKTDIGKGTTFFIYIPALKGVEEEAMSPEKSTEMVKGEGETILLVEDMPLVLESNALLLKELGYNVIRAQNGREAVTLYSQSGIVVDVIVSDIVMPELSGVELYNQLKEKHPDVKIIFVTGYPISDEAKELMKSGRVKWMQKPLDVYELSRLLRSLLTKA